MPLGWLFKRKKIWRGRETALTNDVNNEFQNILDNGRAEKLSGHSVNVSQMQETFDPGEVGSENLPLSTADELKALRFQVKAVTGEAQWYENPDTTIAALKADLEAGIQLSQNRIFAGAVSSDGQPAFLLPETASNQVNILAATTDLETFINGIKVDFTADVSLSSLSLAPSSNNTAMVNDGALTGQESSKTQGENGTEIVIDTIGTEITGVAGKVAAFKINNGVDDEFFLAEVDITNNVLKNAYRGWFFDDAGLTIPRITINNNDLITLMRMTWLFLSNLGGTPTLKSTLNQPFVQGTEPSTAINGDYWLDLAVNEWKLKSGGTFTTDDAVFVGVCAQDDATTVGARAQDFANNFSGVNATKLGFFNSNEVRTTYPSVKSSIYGTLINFEQDLLQWNMANDLDTGVSNSANTTYYFYLKPNGDRVISDIRPHDRSFDLFGYYHPSKPYRALGEIFNNSGSDFDAVSLDSGTYSSVEPMPTNIVFGASSTVGVAGSSVGDTINATITTKGGPVDITFQSGQTTGDAGMIEYSAPLGQTDWFLRLGGVDVLKLRDTRTANSKVPISSLSFTHHPPAGTHTYILRVATGTGAISVDASRMVLVEL